MLCKGYQPYSLQSEAWRQDQGITNYLHKKKESLMEGGVPLYNLVVGFGVTFNASGDTCHQRQAVVLIHKGSFLSQVPPSCMMFPQHCLFRYRKGLTTHRQVLGSPSHPLHTSPLSWLWLGLDQCWASPVLLLLAAQCRFVLQLVQLDRNIWI